MPLAHNNILMKLLLKDKRFSSRGKTVDFAAQRVKNAKVTAEYSQKFFENPESTVYPFIFLKNISLTENFRPGRGEGGAGVVKIVIYETSLFYLLICWME